MKRFNIKKAVAVCLISSFFVMGSLSAEAFALDYPTKPINLVVGFPPGGGGGMAAQVIVGYFTKKWKQPINVIYKPGGNSIPAVHEVYSSKPDGYTLLIDSASTSSIQYASFKALPFKVEDRTFVAGCLNSALLYFSNPARPWKTLKEIAEFVKREPENFNWATLGSGSLTYFNTILFLDAVGADIRRTKKIDFRGGPELFAAMAGGHVDFSQFGIGPVIPMIEAGKLRAIAIIAGNRVKRFPDVPTVGEAGFPGLGLSYWLGLSGPPGLPKEVVEKWNQGMKEASTDPEFFAMGEKFLMTPDYIPSEAYKTMVLKECSTLKEISQRF